MSEITSPDSFIIWGFYSLIGSALQRRVWRGNMENPLFPNLYTILTGPPAVGKGRVIGEVNKILKFHKLKETDDVDDAMTATAHKPKGKNKELPLLIPTGPDSTTYEALVNIMCRSIRTHWYQNGETKKSLYFHSSLTLGLEELSSMFRKHTDDLANFLLCAYDCKNYSYETLSRGDDEIRQPCLNLLAGTTPSFIRTIFNDSLLTDGFASRTCFVMEEEPRFYRLAPPEYTIEQFKARDDIRAHVKKLTGLFGEVKFTQEANDFLEDWWKTDAQHNRPNNSPKLITYYGRKNITVQKLAMIIHFSDSLEMLVGIDECKEALNALEKIERKMHLAVSLDNKNPLARVTDEIHAFLRVNGLTSKADLRIEFWGSLPDGEKSLDNILQFLIQSKRIVTEGMKYKIIK